MYKLKRITRQDIDNFLSADTLAIAGASRNEKSFSASLINHLRLKGYNVMSVNPNFEETNLAKSEFKSIADLPKEANNIVVLTSPSRTASVVRQAIEKGVKNIWIQQKSETPEAILLCDEAGINLISHHCIFMFSQAQGVHKFHYNIMRFFGKLPV